jgi:diketogulonate reductase-like aldo/keto reductase
MAVFGTMERDGDGPNATYDAVKTAIAVGYRAFDLAERYCTLEQVKV